MSKLSRYPGPKPFAAHQAKQFHGRETEAKRLLRMVQTNQLTVLYGRSGYGKSSLLNAAVLPHLENEGYHVINVRMGAYTLQSDNTPLQSTVHALAEDPKMLEQTILDQLVAWDNSLWYYTKTFSINAKKPKLLFVFDQFEELFTYPVPEVEPYENGLAELLHSGLPQRYRDQLKAKKELEDNPQRSEVFERMQIKVIIAIRSNRFHLLERLAPSLPQVLQNTMELDALEREGARRAIVIPARDTELEYSSLPFDYSAAAQEDLLDFLTQEEKIEGILLQILCTHFERLVKKKNKENLTVGKDDLNIGKDGPNISAEQALRDVVDAYYYERIDDLPDDEEETVKRFIEDSLVQRVGDGGMRLSLHQAQIKERFGIGPETLNTLVKNGLLRTEPFLRGGVTYELTHDRLLEPVLKAKEVYEAGESERLKKKLEDEEQKRKEAEKLRAEAEEAQKAAEEQRHLAIAAKRIAEKNEKRAKRLSFFTVLTVLLIALMGLLYFQSRLEVRKQRAELNIVQVKKYIVNANKLLTAGRTKSASSKLQFASQIINEYKDDGTEKICAQYREEEEKVADLEKRLIESNKNGICQ